MARPRYPSPKPKDKEFTRRWDIMVDELASRPTFKVAHLLQLEILCDLYCDYLRLSELIELMGPTVTTEGGRNGPQEKIRPEVSQLNTVRSEIRQYNQILGFKLEKVGPSAKQHEKEEWE